MTKLKILICDDDKPKAKMILDFLCIKFHYGIEIIIKDSTDDAIAELKN